MYVTRTIPAAFGPSFNTATILDWTISCPTGVNWRQLVWHSDFSSHSKSQLNYKWVIKCQLYGYRQCHSITSLYHKISVLAIFNLPKLSNLNWKYVARRYFDIPLTILIQLTFSFIDDNIWNMSALISLYKE